MMRRTMISALAAMLAACSPNSGEAGATSTQSPAAAHPVSGLQVVPLRVIHNGKTFAFKVELARTVQEQAKGLMFRTELGPNEGMVFPFDPPRGASFWMRNTVIPLDLIFIAPDGRISNIAANAIPYDESPLQSVGLAKAVLELRGGRAAELGIVPGDKVEW